MEKFMEMLRTSLGTNLGAHLPKLVVALLIFLVGWIVAALVSMGIGKLLGRTKLDDRLASFLAGGDGDDENAIQVESILATLSFWVLMLLAVVASVDALGLEVLANPLNALLGQVFAYLPMLVGAGFLLGLAWVLAKGLRLLVTRSLEAAKVDQRVGAQAGGGQVPLSKTLGEVSYWLVFLFFLPGVLSTLGAEGLLHPVQTMMDQFLAFLPKLFGAVIIFGAGWLAARIVQNIVTGLLSAAGGDAFAKKTGLDRALGEAGLPKTAGLFTFILVLLPALVGALDALQMKAVTEPVKGLLNTFVGVIPALLGAVLLIGIAHVVARLVAPLLRDVLSGIGVDKLPSMLGMVQAEGAQKPSELVARLFHFALLLLASMEAANAVGLQSLSELMKELAIVGGQVLAGLVVFGLGLYLANLAAGAVEATGTKNASILSALARGGVLFLAGAMALRRMGLADQIVETAFALLMGAVAVAIALAFGLGAKEVAGREVEGWLQTLKK